MFLILFSFFLFIGRLSLPYMGGYCTSKFAVEAFTDALRVELCNWGMKTILIEPGFFKTTMTEKNVLGSQLDQMWSKLSEDKKLEYGEVFLKKSKWVHFASKYCRYIVVIVSLYFVRYFDQKY